MGFTNKELLKAAKELIEKLDLLDDNGVDSLTIPKKADDDYLTDFIKEATDQMGPQDAEIEFTDETKEIIEELTKPKKKTVNEVGKKEGRKKVLPEPEEDEDTEDDEDDDEDEDNDDIFVMLEEIQNAKKIKTLKEIVANNGVFKKSAKKLKAITDIDELREEMIAIIQPEVTEEDADVDTDDDDDGDDEVTVKVDPKKKEKASIKKESVKETKQKKAKKEPKEKASRKEGRQKYVFDAIRSLCKKGATMEQIMKESDDLCVEAGGNSNPTATNVNSYTLQALVAFDVLEKDGKIYKFKK